MCEKLNVELKWCKAHIPDRLTGRHIFTLDWLELWVSYTVSRMR
jgi:hypothetical protein